MARSNVQFQKGLSEAEFDRSYGTEKQCRAVVIAARWPNGFSCRLCGGRSHSQVATRGLFQCTKRRRQTSLIAGTIFASTKLPLRTWFRAMYHLTQSKRSISKIELCRRLGVRQTTAWMIKHKLQLVMMERDSGKRLTERVELDDAYLGGERIGGKRGRGAPGKTPFVAAVETTPVGKPFRLRLRRVDGFTGRAILRFALRSPEPSCMVISDGLSRFGKVTNVACEHQVIPTGRGAAAAETLAFKWVNTELVNIKSAIAGTYRAISSKHAEFKHRFNRRYDLTSMIPRRGWGALRPPPPANAISSLETG